MTTKTINSGLQVTDYYTGKFTFKTTAKFLRIKYIKSTTVKLPCMLTTWLRVTKFSVNNELYIVEFNMN
jgi:hypothetical protein